MSFTVDFLALAYAVLVGPAWLRIYHRLVLILVLLESSAGQRIFHLADLREHC